jgi:hypothetical protein
MDRHFPYIKVPVDGGVITAMRIECCKCEKTDLFRQIGKRFPPIAAEQYFRNHGWTVGKSPRRDKCPECSHPRPVVVKIPVQQEREIVVEEIKADAPREMTRADRRIINDKLDEVYGDTCYKAPWTDAAVARDLGVPKAWVAAVRDEFFGVEGSNPDLEFFRSEAEKIAASVTDITQQFAHLTKQMDALRELASKTELLRRRIERDLK